MTKQQKMKQQNVGQDCNILLHVLGSEIQKAKISTGMYTIYHQGGIMAGYTQFATLPENDEDYLVYMYQPEEHEDFAKFYKRFSGK